ncbi:MAG: carboxypeptidase regulatory-like domain-containing protein [Candidatus Taylorbacteria bacterium]|nr:carboxypeptidase regulatory-like domain-containing protein [Candidatus Taylorbacteria bacterium]
MNKNILVLSLSVVVFVLVTAIGFWSAPNLWASHSTDPAINCAEYGGTWDGTTCQMPTTSSPSPSPTYSPSPEYPTAPTSVTATINSINQVDISWSGATDNVGVTKYNIWRNNAFLAIVNAPTAYYSDIYTYSGQTYNYYVIAFDELGNQSPHSVTSTVTIPSTGSTPAPSPSPTVSGSPAPSPTTSPTPIGSAVITGKVTDGGGLPVSGASVNLQTADYSFWRGTQTDSQGLYRLSEISAGTYTMNIYPPENNTGLISPPPQTITISADQTITKDWAFVKAVKKITGSVVRSDGRPVTDGSVGAFKRDTGGWSESKTDSSGKYSLAVSGGSWDASPRSLSPTADWSYSRSPQAVSFAQDQSVEEKVINFVVDFVDATVTGKIVKPDGSLPPVNSFFVSFRSGEGLEFGAPVEPSGNFSARLIAGTYNVVVYSQDPNFSGPAVPSISVAKNETKNLGTITLVAKNEHIKGRVTDKQGAGLANVQVDAYMPQGFDYASTKTDSSGAFDLRVTAGSWEVMPRPDITGNYYNPGPPKSVTIPAGGTATADFVLLFADSGISGTVVDEQGNFLSDVYGYVNLMTGDGFMSGGGSGGPIERGNFSIKSPAGTYKLGVFMSPDSLYTAGAAQSVTIVSGKTITVKVTVSKNASTIIGSLKDESGKVITGVEARVFAVAETSDAWQEGLVDKATGKYKIRISAGTWYLGYEIDPYSGYASTENPTLKVVVAQNETVTKDIVAVKANSIITGKVSDPLGQSVANVFVAVSRKSFGFTSIVEQGALYEESFVASTDTDQAGAYRINVPAGVYFVKTFINPELGLLSAAEQQITVADGETKTANFILRKGELTITGKILLGETLVGGVFVWGWSDKGGYQETMSAADGSYILNIIGSEIWRVGAAKEINDDFYKSSEIEVKVGTENATQNINLTKIADLPPPTVQTADATAPTVVSIGGGPTVSAPANSISTSGTISISITPDTRAPSQGEIRVVGAAYNMEARDSSGQAVTSFNTDVVVSMPYQDSEITKLGINEDELAIAFWNESAGTWQNLDDCLVNKVENGVTCTTDHFTRFALVAAADITPPTAPAGVKVVKGGQGELVISWTNPVKDYSHIKIYRSTAKDQLGDVTVNDLKATQYKDTGIIDGTTYYYTIRAVDPAGNESANTNQVSAVAVGTSIKKIVAETLTGVLSEGDVISAAGSDDPDVYIINEHGFKRLFLNPVIFKFYGHLGGFSKVKTVDAVARDSYVTSGLFRNCETDDPKVYGVETTGEDTGRLHWVDTTGAEAVSDDPDFFQKVFCINNNEFKWYKKGSNYTSVNQIPVYSRK